MSDDMLSHDDGDDDEDHPFHKKVVFDLISICIVLGTYQIQTQTILIAVVLRPLLHYGTFLLVPLHCSMMDDKEINVWRRSF